VELNSNQLAAIQSTHKKMLIVASAGSGKTSVLIEKAKFLIQSRGVSPHSFLMLTFSNKAANELKERLINQIGFECRKSVVSTFHSFALMILRKFDEYSGISPLFKIIDSEERNRFLSTVANELKVPRFELRDYKELHSKIKQGEMDLPQKYKIIYDSLEKKLLSMNMIEIDDLIPMAIELIKINKVVLSFINETFKYIFVDEYQDINLQQFQLIESLIDSSIQFVAVGDDDQCIYEWRGSKPSIMRDFSFRKDVKSYYLTHNYRSQGNIINLANSIIKLNKTRIPKEMAPTLIATTKPELYEFENREKEAIYISKQIQNLISKSNVQLKEIAILVRNESQTPVIASQLGLLKIPFFNHNTKVFLNKWLIEYLREISKEAVDFSKIINYPFIIIDNLLFKELVNEHKFNNLDQNEALKRLYEKPVKFENSFLFKARVEIINKLLKKKNTLNLIELIDCLLNELLNSGDQINESEMTLFSTTISIARDYINLHISPSISGFCDYFDLITEEIFHNSVEGVQIMTIHKSKGLEFKTVFLPGIDLDNFPNAVFIKTQTDLEAERRLLYVGLTRAKDNLYLTSAKQISKTSIQNGGFFSEVSNSLNKLIHIKVVPSPYLKATYVYKKINPSLLMNQNEHIQIEMKLKIYLDKIYEIYMNNGKVYLNREIEKLCENTEEIVWDLLRNNEISNSSILSTRSFFYTVIKLIIDELMFKTSQKVSDYLKFSPVNSNQELNELFKVINQKNLENIPFQFSDLIDLVRYKNLLDSLHHQYEFGRKEYNLKVINEFKTLSMKGKSDIIISVLKFLTLFPKSFELFELVESKLKY